MLNEEKRQQLDSIVQKMQTNKESDDYIQGVVNDFKGKYDISEQQKPLIQKAKEFGVGLLKSGAETVVNTLPAVLSNVVPGIAPFTQIASTKVVEKLKQTFPKALEVKTPEEKAGKITGDVAQILLPAGIGRKAVGVATGKGIELSAPQLSKVSSMLTGVPKEEIQRAFSNPEKIDNAMKLVSENPKQPFLALADTVAQSIKQKSEGAMQRFVDAVNFFKQQYSGEAFDISKRITEFVEPLKKFNLNLSYQRTPGTLLNPQGGTPQFGKIIKSPQSPFSDNEVRNLQELVDKIQSSKGITPDDLLDLKRSFGVAYDAVPLGVNGNPRPYHAAVMALKEKSEKIFDMILPEPLRSANREYRKFESFMDDVGKKIVDSDGNVKQTAEQFLSNAANINKGIEQRTLGQYAKELGGDLVEEVKNIKAAQKLSQLFPATGSRTQDILRSLLVIGGGTGTMGPLGGIAGAAISSPLITGKAATMLGRASRKLQGK